MFRFSLLVAITTCISELPLNAFSKNTELFDKVGCMPGLHYADVNLIAFMEKQGFVMYSDYHTALRSRAFHRADGFFFSVYTPNETGIVDGATLVFPNRESSLEATDWLSGFGIGQDAKKSVKELEYKIAHEIKKTTYYWGDGYQNESMARQVGFYGRDGIYVSVLWNLDSKKETWIREIELSSDEPFDCSDGIPKMEPRRFAHPGFQPDNPSTFYLMFNQNFSVDDLNHLEHFYQWSVSGDRLYTNSGNFFNIAKDDENGGIRAYSLNLVPACVPAMWLAYFAQQKDLYEQYGNCAHKEGEKPDMLFLHEDSVCFRLQYSAADEDLPLDYYVMTRSGDFSFHFSEENKVEEFRPNIGCVLGNCVVNFGELHYGDGCFFMGDFKMGEFYDGIVYLDKDIPARLVDKEQERLEALKSEIARVKNAWSTSANYWNNAVTQHDELLSTLNAFYEDFGNSFDNLGHIKVNSVERMRAKREYNEVYDLLGKLSTNIMLSNSYLRDLSQCPDFDRKAYFIQLKADIMRKAMLEYNDKIWGYGMGNVYKDVKSMADELKGFMTEIHNLMNESLVIRDTCRIEIEKKYSSPAKE